MNSLPVNAQTIKIEIYRKDSNTKSMVAVSFGQIVGKLDRAWAMESMDVKLWDLKVNQIVLGSLVVDQNSTIIFTSLSQQIKIP